MKRTSFFCRALVAFALSLTVGGLALAQQKDPLEGRWQGTMRTDNGGGPTVITFAKSGKGYSGTITNPLGGQPVAFKEVKLDKDKGNARFEMTPQGGAALSVNIKFNLKGENLQGKADIDLGSCKVTFNYDVNRVVDLQAALPQTGQASSQAELDEYNKVRAEENPEGKKALIEGFVQKYPESGLKALVYQEGSNLGLQTNNVQLMSDYGEKSLVVWPENYTLLTNMGDGYVRRGIVDKAEDKAQKAVQILVAAKKPDHLSEEQWSQGKNMLMSTNFSTLGWVHVRRAQANKDPDQKKAEAEKAIDPLKKSLELNPKDDFALFGLGNAYVALNDIPNAESTLAKAVVVGGPVSGIARPMLEDVFKAQNKSAEVDKALAKAKSELGLP